MSKAKRVCVIGAGPSGMSVLYHFNRLKAQGKEIPEIVCFDKQSDWGGLWKYSWETGTDQYGESVHGSMYRDLWSNIPKECLEYPDYTFEEHFGRAIPSFPPRDVLYDYLKGRWCKGDLRPWIRFNHVVRQVTYNDSTDEFSVIVKNLSEDRVLPTQKFDYVIVATGHYSVPNVPYFSGIDQFPGRILHSHDFRNASQFKGKKVLVIGSMYSAEDIALQCVKFGAVSVVCTWRTKPMGFPWPPQITEKPLPRKIEGNTVHLKDGTTIEVDVIILCTGYLLSFPFLADDLRLKSSNVLYPPGLYKGTIWTRGGNNKLLYVGMQDQLYTFTMFDAQAKWAVNYITGEISLPDKQNMENDCKRWVARMEDLPVKGFFEALDFQTAFVMDVAKETNYGYDLDVTKLVQVLVEHKMTDLTTYRDQSYTSLFTGTKSPVYHTPFMKAFDDSMKCFLNVKEYNSSI